MKIKHLLEGAEPKLPGAVSGIQIMTPQQFVAKSAKGEEHSPEKDVEEGIGKDMAKLGGIAALGIGAGLAGNYYDQQQPRIEVGGQKAYLVKNPGWGTVPDNAMTLQGKDGKTYTVWAKKGKGSTQYYATPADNVKEGVAEADKHSLVGKIQRGHELKKKVDSTFKDIGDAQKKGDKEAGSNAFRKHERYANLERPGTWTKSKEQGVAEGLTDNDIARTAYMYGLKHGREGVGNNMDRAKAEWGDNFKHYNAGFLKGRNEKSKGLKAAGQGYGRKQQGVAEGSVWSSADQKMKHYSEFPHTHSAANDIRSSMSGKVIVTKGARLSALGNDNYLNLDTGVQPIKLDPAGVVKQGVAEATKLPAQTRDLKGDELEAYLDRIRNQEKQKTDKYKMPYIHRSSVMGYYNEEGKKYNTDAIKAALKERPKALLKKNEKMKHSDGEQEQFFNIGFAALTGIALDENTNEIIIVNTCPGAGSCKVDCFAMKGGKIQFQGPWLSDGRILTYLLNNPDGFFSQLKSEIEKEELKGKKGGYKVSIRWHDAGDFFSPEYAGLAFKLANELPNVQFYAYTKIAGVALGQKPDNFMINWSEGASTSQEKQVKAADPNLERTKNSRIVPSNLFYDLLVKDEKKNLVKGAEGQWQVIPDKLPELKQRLAKQYGISPSSILSYTEWDQKTQGGKKETPIKYNVIITPGEPDITAKSSGVLSTLLLKH